MTRVDPKQVQALFEAEATLALVENGPLTHLHVFPFSPRPSTRAAALPDRVPAEVVKRRAAELRALGRELRDAYARRCLGRRLEVVVERAGAGMVRGTTREGLSIGWPARGEVRGETVWVRATGATEGGVLSGEREPAGDPGARVPASNLGR